MTVDYPLEDIDPHTFQQIGIALSRAVLGQGVAAYGAGPDGGRDATFEGRVEWSNTPGFGEDVWEGYVVIQAKHRSSKDLDPARSLRWLKNHVSSELKSWTNADSEKRRTPEYLLFITNAKLSPGVGGGIESIDAVIREESGALRAKGLKGWNVWHRDQLISLLTNHADVRRQFPSFLTAAAADILTRLESLERKQLEPMRDVLLPHAQNRLRYEQWVNFGEAGAESRKPICRVVVDLPVQLPDGSRTNALAALVKASERVLRRSLSRESPRRHVVLTGAPGNGKSTLSQYLVQLYRAAFLAGESLPNSLQPVQNCMADSLTRLALTKPRQQRWPIQVDMAEWASSSLRDRTVIHWISHLLGDALGQKVTPSDVRRWLKEWPWLVVFDGLDEVTDLNARRSVLHNIAAFVDEIDDDDCDAFIVVTTRPGGYAEELPAEHFAEYELAYFTTPEATHYGRLITRARLSEDQDRADRVLQRFEEASKDPATLRLLKTPLQVLIVTVILEHHRTLPVNRYGLFWAYFETLFAREKAKSNELAEFLTSFHQDVTHLHETVGLRLQIRSEEAANSKASLKLKELRQIADERFLHVGYTDDDERRRLVDNMLDAATKRLILLVPGEPTEDGSETVMFELRSLQELMAARSITHDEPQAVHKRLVILAPSPHWRNTWVFSAGRLFAHDDESKWDLVTDVLASLDSQDDWPGWLVPIAPGLAAELLDDGLAATKPKWQQQLLTAALSALSPPVPIDTASIARGLTVSWLGKTLQKVVQNKLEEALQGTEAAQFAASRVLAESSSPLQRGRVKFKELQVKVAPKGRNRKSLGRLIRPEIQDLFDGTVPPAVELSLTELDTVQTVEQKTPNKDTTLVGARPKSPPDWGATVGVLSDAALNWNLHLAVETLPPQDWPLVHLAAREIYPALARRPVGCRINLSHPHA